MVQERVLNAASHKRLWRHRPRWYYVRFSYIRIIGQALGGHLQEGVCGHER